MINCYVLATSFLAVSETTSIRTYLLLRKEDKGCEDGSVKYLTHKHEDLNLILANDNTKS